MRLSSESSGTMNMDCSRYSNTLISQVGGILPGGRIDGTT
jgi:hypothetical protein